MRKKQVTILSLLVVFIFTATTAFAAMGIKNLTTSVGTPTSTGGAAATRMASAGSSTLMAAAGSSSSCVAPDPTRQLEVCFSLIRVGKPDVDVTAIVDGTVTVRCSNPGGNNPPGQQVAIQTVATDSFPSDKNGNVSGELTATVNIPPGAACPGNMVQSLDPHFQTLRFIVEQNNVDVINQLFNLPPN